MIEWLTLEEASRFAGVSVDAVRRRIYRGVYTKIQRLEPYQGREGFRYVISVNDPRLAAEIKQKAARLLKKTALNDLSAETHLSEIKQTLHQIKDQLASLVKDSKL